MPIYKYYTAQGCLAQGFTVHIFFGLFGFHCIQVKSHTVLIHRFCLHRGFPKVFQVFSRGFSKMALMCIFLFIIFQQITFFYYIIISTSWTNVNKCNRPTLRRNSLYYLVSSLWPELPNFVEKYFHRKQKLDIPLGTT